MDDVWAMIRAGPSPALAQLAAQEKAGIAKPSPSDGHLLDIALQENRDLIPWLLEQGVNPNRRDTAGGTVLMYAAAQNLAEIVELLLRHGADVRAKNDSGETAFSYACANNALAAAKALHAAGAEINTIDAGGGSPLDWAKQWASKEFHEWLVEVGCVHAFY
jgi:ankyrin repeat protein